MVISDFTVLKRLLDPVKIKNIYFFKPVKGFSFDSRTIKRGQAFIAVKGKYHDGHKFIQEAVRRGASLVICQKNAPKRPCKTPFFLVKDSYQSACKIARYIREEKKPKVLAITGSVGKTTTKEMLAFLLEKDFKVLKNPATENNFFGVSRAMFNLKDEKVMVLELGTNAPGEINDLAQMIYPDIALITFVKPVHLEGLKSLNGIFREKTQLLKVNPKVKAVLNRDDDFLRRYKGKQKIYWYGSENSCQVSYHKIKSDRLGSYFLINGKYKLFMPANYGAFIVNAVAALAATKALGLPLKKMVKRMNGFKRYPSSRMEIKKRGKFIFLNDAYNANPFALSQALAEIRNYPLSKMAVIGDMLELGPKSEYYHRQIAGDVIKGGFDYCLLLGKFTKYLKDELLKKGYDRAYHFESHKKAADFVSSKANGEYLIFLKGSRGMGLEKVMELVK